MLLHNNKNISEFLLYQTEDGDTCIDVKLQDETVWLTQAQMAELFKTTKQNISQHIKNIYNESELIKESTVQDFLTVQKEGGRFLSRVIDYYNLDVIISVGYRIKSPRGTQFRIWASKILKEFLIHGYSLNQQKLASDNLIEFKKTVDFLSSLLAETPLILNFGENVDAIIKNYSKTWKLLQQYDEKELLEPLDLHKVDHELINYKDALLAIDLLKQNLISKNQAGEFFGKEQNSGLKSILGNLEQAFSGKYLYPSAEERAAHLLYFVIKNHPFIDGNKRIGCLLFLLFLNRSNIHLENMQQGALTSLALFVAESPPEQKELMVKLIMNLILG